MVCVGSFKSLQSVLRKPGIANHLLEVHTWIPTKIGLISPLVDWLMRLIAGSRCVEGSEDSVALAVQEALSNAMLHGNSLNAGKLVHVRCCCELETGVFIVVRDHGPGFDPSRVSNPLANENLTAEHGRGIYFHEYGRGFVRTKGNRGPLAQRSRSEAKSIRPPGARGTSSMARQTFAKVFCVGSLEFKRSLRGLDQMRMVSTKLELSS